MEMKLGSELKAGMDDSLVLFLDYIARIERTDGLRIVILTKTC